ncbi:vitellogenin-1-like [Episyrphus balteatus]|uniref:vitellogenin-1-like n=1 Tax=Episyrphus balteatus TaxID=286459 RepID=UPI002486B014|nr:vitellogenin-1-like [Episyrphus balteatus]
MKFAAITIFFSLILLHSSESAITFGDILTGSKDTLIGVVSNVGTLIPTPTQFFSGTKNLLAGYPIEVVSTAINEVCSTLMYSDSITPKIMPDLKTMNFQFITPCQKYLIPILSPGDLLKIGAFDFSKKTVILVTGWRTTIDNSDTIVELSKAYNCRGGVNFIAIDVASAVDTLFTWSALNTEKLGEYLGQALADLVKYIPVESLHLIGHSLGAHIVGAAGRTFTEITEQKLPHITGLDPAKPCFNEGENLSGLMRGDAQFIDVIHSNPGVLGKRDPTGDVDFYPDGLAPLPKGCLTVTCAHSRAWEYYVESVYPGNEFNFMAYRCNSLLKLQQGRCSRNIATPMGYASVNSLKGNYFLEVRGSSPFGLNGNKTRDEANAMCGE